MPNAKALLDQPSAACRAVAVVEDVQDLVADLADVGARLRRSEQGQRRPIGARCLNASYSSSMSWRTGSRPPTSRTSHSSSWLPMCARSQTSGDISVECCRTRSSSSTASVSARPALPDCGSAPRPRGRAAARASARTAGTMSCRAPPARGRRRAAGRWSSDGELGVRRQVGSARPRTRGRPRPPPRCGPSGPPARAGRREPPAAGRFGRLEHRVDQAGPRHQGADEQKGGAPLVAGLGVEVAHLEVAAGANGREHRASGDSRDRRSSDRRSPRAPASVQARRSARPARPRPPSRRRHRTGASIAMRAQVAGGSSTGVPAAGSPVGRCRRPTAAGRRPSRCPRRRGGGSWRTTRPARGRARAPRPSAEGMSVGLAGVETDLQAGGAAHHLCAVGADRERPAPSRRSAGW